MRLQHQAKRRTGSVLPLVAVSLVALLGMVALAIDLGLLLVSRTECQHAADCAAMAGARTLNGDVANSNNKTAAGPNMVTAATTCKVLDKTVQSSWLSYEIGYYTYDRTNNVFGKILPSSGGTMPSNENWSLATATVSFTNPTSFAKVFGLNTFSTQATATAVHRPRDIAVIIDFSGSMSFDSLLGSPYSGNRTQGNNPETVFPQFGHYSSGFNPVPASPYVLASGEVLGFSNITTTTAAGTPLVDDYYQNAVGATPVKAFTAAPASYATAPAGDLPLRQTNNGSGQPYASTLAQVLGTSNYTSGWETNGYSWSTLNGGATPAFNGYTMGPSYWGKTFRIWPPDPRSANDWRKKFFLKGDKTTPVDDNSILWTTGASPAVRVPIATGSLMTNYYINYAAIIRWLKTTGPNPFPNQLRAGRINYYTAIPDVSNSANDAAFNNRMYGAAPTDLNERFWKQYIDHVLGFEQNGTTYTDINSTLGYGPDLTFGTKSISAKPVANGTAQDTPTARYMNYADNPPRGNTRYWFGPMTMLDFIDNYNQGRRWMPGTAHQASSWGCKIGMRAAIQDIEKNHPNDYVCLSFFNTPEYSAGDGGRFNRIRTPLGRSYQQMVDKLFYPPITVDNPASYQEVNCYDSTNMRETPHADGATCPAMSFMQAYNQFATSTSLSTFNPSGPVGDAGGLGRKGAQKIIIFETDGVANTAANATFTNSGAYQSYYRIRIPGEYPTNSGTVDTQIYAVAQQICNLDTAASPGYSTVRKPVLIHSIAYGSLFDPSVSGGASAARNSALAILQQVQYIGKTQANASTPLQSYKIITGTADQRITLIQQAFQKIMQDSVSVTLIE